MSWDRKLTHQNAMRRRKRYFGIEEQECVLDGPVTHVVRKLADVDDLGSRLVNIIRPLFPETIETQHHVENSNSL